MVNSHGRFVWYELVTTDIRAAVAFYSNVMGWNAWDVSAPGKDYILFGDGKGGNGSCQAVHGILPQATLASFFEPSFSLNSRSALPPRMLRFAVSLRNGRW